MLLKQHISLKRRSIFLYCKKDLFLASYFAYGINRNSKNSEIAWDLLTTLASPDIERLISKLQTNQRVDVI